MKCGITVHLNKETSLLDAALPSTLTMTHIPMKMVKESCHLHLHRHHTMMGYTQL
jgi:hypothetical protein